MAETQNLEMRNCCTFSQFKEDEYQHALYRYKHAGEFYPRKKLSKLTGGVGETEYFRHYLKEYVNNFTPEKLRNGKPYLLELDDDGRFIVTGGVTDETPCLSESERTIYHYLCFIHVVEFWQGIEKIRNINYEPEHLIIDDFIGKVDASININQYLEMARKLDSDAEFKEKMA